MLVLKGLECLMGFANVQVVSDIGHKLDLHFRESEAARG